MRVLLTGAAGFIGSRVDAALRAAGHDVVGVDALLPAAHGPDPVLPNGCRQVDVRDADALAPLLDGVDLVCHQAAMVGAGVDAADAPAYGGHNDFATTVLLAQMFAAGVRRLVLASSMVVYGQGHYACPDHGLVDPLPRRRADLDAGVFEHRCPVCGVPVAWRLVDEDAPLRPRSLYAASKTAQEHYALAWSESTRRLGGGVALPQRLRPRHAARHPVFRGGRDLPLGPRKEPSRQGFSKTAGRCVTSCTSTTWPPPTSRRPPLTLMALLPSMSAPGGPSRSWRWPARCATRAQARSPR